VVRIYEVAVVRQPTEREDGHHDDEHPHHLLTERPCSCASALFPQCMSCLSQAIKSTFIAFGMEVSSGR
jgi:hypothetical protein